MEIRRNSPEQLFSAGSGRITLKNCLRDYFDLLKSQILGCRFLDVLVLIHGLIFKTFVRLNVRLILYAPKRTEKDENIKTELVINGFCLRTR